MVTPEANNPKRPSNMLELTMVKIIHIFFFLLLFPMSVWAQEQSLFLRVR